jgi:hypothetical protein
VRVPLVEVVEGSAAATRGVLSHLRAVPGGSAPNGGVYTLATHARARAHTHTLLLSLSLSLALALPLS